METVRLPGRGLQPDETISSLLDRAGSLCGMGRESIGRALLQRWRSSHPAAPTNVPDWDDPPDEALAMLAAACDIKDWEHQRAIIEKREARGARPLPRHKAARELLNAVIIDGPRWLKPGYRTAWCPLCFARDIARGGVPYFRWQWARVASTFCNLNHPPIPLVSWPERDGEKGQNPNERHLPKELMTDRLIVPIDPKKDAAWFQTARARHMLRSTEQDGRNWYTKYDRYMTLEKPASNRAPALTNWELDLDELLALEEIQLEKSGASPAEQPPALDDIRALLIAIGEQAGQLTPNEDGWFWSKWSWHGVPSIDDNPDQEPTATQQHLWEDVRSWENPASRRALFWLGACAQGWPLEDLAGKTPIFIPLWFRWANVAPLLEPNRRVGEWLSRMGRQERTLTAKRSPSLKRGH